MMWKFSKRFYPDFGQAMNIIAWLFPSITIIELIDDGEYWTIHMRKTNMKGGC